MPHAGDAVLEKCIAALRKRKAREVNGRKIKMDGEAVNKGERAGVVCRESIKEIQNTSYNSHFQKTAREVWRRLLYAAAPARTAVGTDESFPRGGRLSPE